MFDPGSISGVNLGLTWYHSGRREIKQTLKFEPERKKRKTGGFRFSCRFEPNRKPANRSGSSRFEQVQLQQVRPNRLGVAVVYDFTLSEVFTISCLVYFWASLVFFSFLFFLNFFFACSLLDLQTLLMGRNGPNLKSSKKC